MDDYEAITRIMTGDYSGLGFDTVEDALQELSDHLDNTVPQQCPDDPE